MAKLTITNKKTLTISHVKLVSLVGNEKLGCELRKQQALPVLSLWRHSQVQILSTGRIAGLTGSLDLRDFFLFSFF